MERDTVSARSRRGFKPVGIALGSFRLQPALTSEITATDNVHARRDVNQGDVSLSPRPNVSRRSEWHHHAQNLAASGLAFRM